MTLVDAGRRVYRVKGFTEDFTACELCGREELRGTVALVVLDADGNGTGEVVHYGSECGARAAGWTVRELKANVRAAEAEERARAAAAARARQAEENAAFCGWVLRAYGVSISQPADLWGAGIGSPFEVRRAYRQATGCR